MRARAPEAELEAELDRHMVHRDVGDPIGRHRAGDGPGLGAEEAAGGAEPARDRVGRVGCGDPRPPGGDGALLHPGGHPRRRRRRKGRAGSPGCAARSAGPAGRASARRPPPARSRRFRACGHSRRRPGPDRASPAPRRSRWRALRPPGQAGAWAGAQISRRSPMTRAVAVSGSIGALGAMPTRRTVTGLAREALVGRAALEPGRRRRRRAPRSAPRRRISVDAGRSRRT